ncbi:MAG: hypothetical protein WD294_08830 [Phycisphaeraceae bacterium]
MSEAINHFACPAKVNLALSVGKPQPDGLHPISSWMVRVSLHDDLLLRPLGPNGEPATAHQPSIVKGDPADDLKIEWSPDALLPTPIDWPAEKDLAVRAHALIERHVGRKLPLQGQLRKRIPVGAGLAGGSSDGATMLRAVDELFQLNLPDDVLRKLAGELGSDLAFFLGEPSAIISGTGDKLEPMPLRRPLHLVLILPALQCNTGAVYRAFDKLAPDAALAEQRVRQAASASAVTDDSLFNDLAEAAMHVEPSLREVHFWCEQAADRPVHVTGSGAGMFVLAEDAEEAGQLSEQLRREARVAALAVRTP